MRCGYAGGLPPVVERIRRRKVIGVDGFLGRIERGCGFPVAGAGGGERIAGQQDALLMLWIAAMHSQCPVIGVDDDPVGAVPVSYLLCEEESIAPASCQHEELG